MSANFSALREIEHAGLDRALETLDRLDDTQARTLFAGVVGDVLERSARDGYFWLRFVLTRDEADPSQSIKPFPIQLTYLHQLWDLLVSRQCLAVAKSRQMLVSWLVATFCCWWARFQANQAIYWQTQQWKDACAMISMPKGAVLGRCQFIERNLPVWMQQNIVDQEGVLYYPNGSLIQALPGGANQIRSKVASVIVQDEFAMQEEAQGVYTACAPLIQKGAKFIAVSTPNGTGNQFATLFHGRSMGAV